MSEQVKCNSCSGIPYEHEHDSDDFRVRSSDEWISIEDSMPPINKNVEVLTTGNHKHEACLIYICDGFCLSKFEFKSGSSSRAINVTHWRPLPENKPDFGKLKEGDPLIVQFSYGLTTLLTFIKIDNAEYPFLGYFYSPSAHEVISARSPLDEIKKITRINLEKQTFEEI